MKRPLVALCAIVAIIGPLRAFADASDGYDSPLAKAVRSATQRYRLVLWARLDGYVQSTDYLPAVGTMYTNHNRFDPKDLAEPTLLVYDTGGRLAACGYQFLKGTTVFSALAGPEVNGWYDIPKHVHYNIVVNGTAYYAQQIWEGVDEPTAPELIKRKLMPANATLKFAFVHPATRAIFVWAWAPNSNGLFASENPALP